MDYGNEHDSKDDENGTPMDNIRAWSLVYFNFQRYFSVYGVEIGYTGYGVLWFIVVYFGRTSSWGTFVPLNWFSNS